jgi:hypothetical protein
MDPTILLGTRKFLTELDLAGLNDLGYTVTAIPEPAQAVWLVGLVALGWTVVRRPVRRGGAAPKS